MTWYTKNNTTFQSNASASWYILLATVFYSLLMGATWDSTTVDWDSDIVAWDSLEAGGSSSWFSKNGSIWES